MKKHTLTTPRGEVTIRPTREDDAPAFRALRLKGLQDHPTVFGADYATNAAQPIEHWQERLRAGSGDDERVTYVADAAGALIGMTTMVRNDLPKTRHAGSIFGVYTHPDWRGTGVADALLEACAAYARALGIRLLRLGVATDNTSAINLYVRNGYAVYGIEPESIQVDGVFYDELLMAKRLYSEDQKNRATEITEHTEIGFPAL